MSLIQLYTINTPLNNAMYFQHQSVTAASATTSNIVQVPAEAPSGIYEVQLPPLNPLNSLQVRAYNQGKMGTWDLILSTLYQANQPIVNSQNGVMQSYFIYDGDNDTCYTNLAIGEAFLRCSLFVNHTTGRPTDFFRIENASEGWSVDDYVAGVIIKQIA